jgi:lipopolysaccharide export system protein LptA
LKSVNVNTRTLKPRLKDAKEDPPPALTWSKEMRAEFDPKTNQLAKLEQWNDFRYEEGTRKAKADRALLEQAQNIIHLTGSSRVWDPTGSTEGDTIVMDEKNGDFSAEGKVNSTRMPDKKKDENSSGGLLSEDEPMHAKAKKMSSTDNNLQVRYEGNAIAWQGSDRLEADVIEIDRDNNIVKAHGHVVSQLLDKADSDSKGAKDKDKDPEAKPKAAKPPETKQKKDTKPGAAPIFTIVKAPEMVYKDDDKLATYTGGVSLDRPNMKVKSEILRAFLRDTDDDSSSLDHAFADGKVDIVQTTLGRTRTGTSEHAEYYVDEAKVILEKGEPQLMDTVKGSTKGKKLTWFSDDDRLLVDGAEGEPAKSKLKRKHAAGGSKS